MKLTLPESNSMKSGCCIRSYHINYICKVRFILYPRKIDRVIHRLSLILVHIIVDFKHKVSVCDHFFVHF